MKSLMTISSILKLAGLTWTAGLLIIPDQQPLALWGLFFTGIVTLITNWYNRSADRKDAEQRHRWEMEDRETKAREVKADLELAKQIVTLRTDAIRDDIAKNTELTIMAASKADAAYDVANHVNEKIARLHERSASD